MPKGKSKPKIFQDAFWDISNINYYENEDYLGDIFYHTSKITLCCILVGLSFLLVLLSDLWILQNYIIWCKITLLRLPLSCISFSIYDMFEIGATDNHLNLFNESDASSLIAVKTPVGITKRTEVRKIVAQGEVNFPLKYPPTRLCGRQDWSFILWSEFYFDDFSFEFPN